MCAGGYLQVVQLVAVAQRLVVERALEQVDVVQQALQALVGARVQQLARQQRALVRQLHHALLGRARLRLVPATGAAALPRADLGAHIRSDLTRNTQVLENRLIIFSRLFRNLENVYSIKSFCKKTIDYFTCFQYIYTCEDFYIQSNKKIYYSAIYRIYTERRSSEETTNPASR